MALALGMNSGSSFDGIDTVVIELEIGEDGNPTPPRLLEWQASAWPAEVVERVHRAFLNKLTIFELTRLNYIMGAVYAEAARSLMRAMNLTGADLDVIGVDGQTIYQEPPNPDLARSFAPDELVARWLDGPNGCGLQVGEPAIIAAHCDAPVVWNFRPSDHALGGTGAPLMQYLDYLLFRDLAPIVTMNIGGINSSTFLPGQTRDGILGFDTAAGNVMIDHAMRLLYAQPYDRDGLVAASGTVDDDLFADLREHPFFMRKPPRSAWRLDFGADYADAMMAKHAHLASQDMVATFTRYTAWGTAESLLTYVLPMAPIRTIIASGGGAANPVLLQMMREYLPDSVELTTCADYGIPVQAKEGMKFATLAYATRRGLANNIPSASGASGYIAMGKLVLPPRLSTLTA